MTTPNDIWQSGKGELPEEKLLAYLEGKLSPEEQYEVETWLAEEGMESDALEGLQSLPANDTRKLVNRINYKLQNDLRKKRHQKRGYFADNKWAWVAVLIVLLLAVLGYAMVRLMQ